MAQGKKHIPLAEVLIVLREKQEPNFFPRPSTDRDFRVATNLFEEDSRDNHELKVLIIPTTERLGMNPLYQLLSHDIFLIEVTKSPIAADGIVRPSDYFFLHDLRHSALIYVKLKKYFEINEVNSDQRQALTELSDFVLNQFVERLEKMDDNDLKKALIYSAFSFHHGQGLTLLPSSFQNHGTGFYTKFSYYLKKLT